MWQTFAWKHWGIRKKLRIDNEMCDILLSNKKVFKGMIVYKDSSTYPRIFTAKIGEQYVRAAVYTRFKKHNIKDHERCYGTFPRQKGVFNYQCRDMVYLSHFLGTLAAWLAQKKRGNE